MSNYIDDDRDIIMIPDQWFASLADAIDAAGMKIVSKKVTPTKCSCGEADCAYDTKHVFTRYRVVPK